MCLVAPDYSLRPRRRHLSLLRTKLAPFILIADFEAVLGEEKVKPLIIELVFLRRRIKYLKRKLSAVFFGGVFQDPIMLRPDT